MTLRIGNKRGLGGFTLIEILVTVSVVALAAVFISQSNLLNGAVYGRYGNRLAAQNFAAQKIWDIKESILAEEYPAVGVTQGDFAGATRIYRWKAEVKQEQEKLSELYLIEMEVLWNEGGGENSLKRHAGILKVQGP